MRHIKEKAHLIGEVIEMDDHENGIFVCVKRYSVSYIVLKQIKEMGFEFVGCKTKDNSLVIELYYPKN